MSRELSYQLTLRLCFEEKSFGPGPMRLLQGVKTTGSLHRAAGEMGMAYSKAWKLIRKLEQDWGFALIVRRSGGLGGGGSVLTEEGKELLERYEAMLAEVERAADAAMKKYFS
ncbi:MAG: winged helix-turn-helix domain-containing protein [Butyricicoccus sp.]